METFPAIRKNLTITQTIDNMKQLTEDKLRSIIREELLKEDESPTVVNTPKYDIKVYNSAGNGNLKMIVTDSGANRRVADITLGKKGGQKLMDALTYHL